MRKKPQKETSLMQDIMFHLSRAGATVFRNNVGMAKTEDGRQIRYGLIKGSSDLIGWTPVVITQDMVGMTVGIFTAIEVKSLKGKGPTEAQENFIRQVNNAGGIAGIARTEQEAENIIKPWGEITS